MGLLGGLKNFAGQAGLALEKPVAYGGVGALTGGMIGDAADDTYGGQGGAGMGAMAGGALGALGGGRQGIQELVMMIARQLKQMHPDAPDKLLLTEAMKIAKQVQTPQPQPMKGLGEPPGFSGMAADDRGAMGG